MNSPLWLSFCWVGMLTVVGIWLFLSGYQNIKTGRETNFGYDHVLHFFDRLLNNKKGRWNDPRSMKLVGIYSVLFAISVLIPAAIFLIKYILPRIK
jgi:hypothetical protein